jgi:hypothetical protein
MSTTVLSTVISKIDETDDIYHETIRNNKSTLTENQQRPHIDIYKISYLVTDDNKVQLTIVIQGFIRHLPNVTYTMWYNTTNTSYSLQYTNGMNTGYAIVKETGEKFTEVENVSVDAHTITVTYNQYGNETAPLEFWGYTMENYEEGTTRHIWADYVPEKYSPYGNMTDDEQNGINEDASSTPSFGIVGVIFALSVVVLVLISRKRK